MPTDPNLDNSVPPQDAPPVDNGRIKELEDKIQDLQEGYKSKLSGSKAEALRLKDEKEQLKTRLEELENKLEPPAQVDETDVEIVKKLAKKAGFISQEELNKQLDKVKSNFQKKEQEEAIDKFYVEYPEYNPDNDKDNKKWEGLMKEFGTYKLPNEARSGSYLNLLKKAHKSISPDNSLEKGRALGHAEANLGDHAKLGGSSSSSPDGKRTPAQQVA